MPSVATRRSIALAAAGLPIIALAWVAAKSGWVSPRADHANYRIVYRVPSAEWKVLPHGPQTLFLYQHAKSHILIRGAVNQIIAEVNPTPELNTDAMAQFFIDRTHDNMPNWTAEMLDEVAAKNTAFRMIKRAKSDKEVVTAYAVKGNTTLMVTLSGNGREMAAVEEEMPHFRDYLSTIAMQKQDMSAL